MQMIDRHTIAEAVAALIVLQKGKGCAGIEFGELKDEAADKLDTLEHPIILDVLHYPMCKGESGRFVFIVDGKRVRVESDPNKDNVNGLIISITGANDNTNDDAIVGSITLFNNEENN